MRNHDRVAPREVACSSFSKQWLRGDAGKELKAGPWLEVAALCERTVDHKGKGPESYDGHWYVELSKV